MGARPAAGLRAAERKTVRKIGGTVTNHGHAAGRASATYVAWDNMIGRCERRKHDPSTVYWRGVSVCEQWRSFSGFLADMGEKPPGTTLDRIDGSKGYEPGNCRWASRAAQSRNTRIPRNNTSGAKGVSWQGDKGCWRATIAVKRKQIFLGCFATFDAAVAAREAGEVKYWGSEK